jgi:hypothetical protein
VIEARLVAEDGLHGARQTREHDREVVVVDGEHAPGLQVVLHGIERLDREQVALEPERRLPRHQRQRVRQREQDQVVARVGVLQERAAVVHVLGHTRVVVGVVRVPFLPDPLQHRVDLHGVDVRGSLREATATSLPVPAPTMRTLPGGPARWRYGYR